MRILSGVSMMLAAAQAAARPVTELQPQQLEAFIARHEYVVVQLTSPDPGCGYCKGANRFPDHAKAYQDALQAWSGELRQACKTVVRMRLHGSAGYA